MTPAAAPQPAGFPMDTATRRASGIAGALAPAVVRGAPHGDRGVVDDAPGPPSWPAGAGATLLDAQSGRAGAARSVGRRAVRRWGGMNGRGMVGFPSTVPLDQQVRDAADIPEARVAGSRNLKRVQLAAFRRALRRVVRARRRPAGPEGSEVSRGAATAARDAASGGSSRPSDVDRARSVSSGLHLGHGGRDGPANLSSRPAWAGFLRLTSIAREPIRADACVGTHARRCLTWRFRDATPLSRSAPRSGLQAPLRALPFAVPGRRDARHPGPP